MAELKSTFAVNAHGSHLHNYHYFHRRSSYSPKPRSPFESACQGLRHVAKAALSSPSIATGSDRIRFVALPKGFQQS